MSYQSKVTILWILVLTMGCLLIWQLLPEVVVSITTRPPPIIDPGPRIQ